MVKFLKSDINKMSITLYNILFKHMFDVDLKFKLMLVDVKIFFLEV